LSQYSRLCSEYYHVLQCLFDFPERLSQLPPPLFANLIATVEFGLDRYLFLFSLSLSLCFSFAVLFYVCEFDCLSHDILVARACTEVIGSLAAYPPTAAAHPDLIRRFLEKTLEVFLL
jgi:hypothetical protein